jgi:hypothetical protein
VALSDSPIQRQGAWRTLSLVKYPYSPTIHSCCVEEYPHRGGRERWVRSSSEGSSEGTGSEGDSARSTAGSQACMYTRSLLFQGCELLTVSKVERQVATLRTMIGAMPPSVWKLSVHQYKISSIERSLIWGSQSHAVYHNVVGSQY